MQTVAPKWSGGGFIGARRDWRGPSRAKVSQCILRAFGGVGPGQKHHRSLQVIDKTCASAIHVPWDCVHAPLCNSWISERRKSPYPP